MARSTAPAGLKSAGIGGADAARALYALNPIEGGDRRRLDRRSGGEGHLLSTSMASLSSRPRSPTNSRTNLTNYSASPAGDRRPGRANCFGLRGVHRRSAQQSCLGRARGPRGVLSMPNIALGARGRLTDDLA